MRSCAKNTCIMSVRRRFAGRILLLLLSLAVCLEAQVRQDTSARLNGDFVIGALFSVHQQPTRGSQNALMCGAIRELYGIQRIETALWTLDQINNNSDVLRGRFLCLLFARWKNSALVSVHLSITLSASNIK